MTSSPPAHAPALWARSVALLTGAAVVAILYFAQDFLLPIALAALFSFLLAPLTYRLERWRLGRVPSVIVVSLLAFAAIGGLGYVITGQLIDLANTLPKYQSNLHAKIVSLKTSEDGPWNRATNTFRELSAELTKVDPTPLPPVTPPVEKQAVPVEVIRTAGSAVDTLRTFLAPIAGPLGTAAVVIVLVIFMLLGREDVRDRVIHLFGRGRLHVTTQALDEAGARVSRYLVAQCVVNVTYGIPIGVGLWLIGLPNAVLWGVLAALLRFVPYVGAWIAAAFPLALSLAVAPSWNAPLLTLVLFIVMELLSNNVIEPWLYGSSTGLSPLAIIVAAIFWTWLWGGVGLLLATPLTVCIAVLGKHLPDLAFLDVLLGDRPPIVPSDRIYQRLLALDAEEVSTLCGQYVAEHSLPKMFDDVLAPALRLVDAEYRARQLDDETRREMYRIVREVIAELGEEQIARQPRAFAPPSAPPSFLCLPANNESDELGAFMLSQLLALGGLPVELVSAKALVGEMVALAAERRPRLLCISAVPPTSVLPAQHLCRRLRQQLGKETRLLIGLWNEEPVEQARRLDRFKRAEADEVFVKFGDAAREILLQAGFTPVAA